MRTPDSQIPPLPLGSIPSKRPDNPVMTLPYRQGTSDYFGPLDAEGILTGRMPVSIEHMPEDLGTWA